MKSNERFAALAARQGVPGLEGVKALSIRAPWGWLVGKGLKPVENREWNYNPKFRGRFLIHQTATCMRKEWLSAQRLIASRFPQVEALRILGMFPLLSSMPVGAIIGEAVVANVWRPGAPDILDASGRPVRENPWYMGHTALLIESAQLYAKPIFCPGALGFWTPKL